MNYQQAVYKQYITRFAGELTPEKAEKIEAVEDDFQNLSQGFAKLQAAYAAGEISREQYEEETCAWQYFSAQRRDFRAFYTQYLQVRALEERGITPVLLDKTSTAYLFESKKRGALSFAVMVVLLLLAVLPMGGSGENMRRLICSTARGRSALFGRQMGLAAGFSALMAAGRWGPVVGARMVGSAAAVPHLLLGRAGPESGALYGAGYSPDGGRPAGPVDRDAAFGGCGIRRMVFGSYPDERPSDGRRVGRAAPDCGDMGRVCALPTAFLFESGGSILPACARDAAFLARLFPGASGGIRAGSAGGKIFMQKVTAALYPCGTSRNQYFLSCIIKNKRNIDKIVYLLYNNGVNQLLRS